MVLRKALASRPAEYFIGAVYSNAGFGYLKKQAGAFNNAAKGCPFLLLTDLDQHVCPPVLIRSWLDQPLHEHFLLRVAVREVEAWLLADVRNLARFLRIRREPVLIPPEQIPDPKRELLTLAWSSSSRDIREALVWQDEHGQFRQGPDYNGRLSIFIQNHWDIQLSRTKTRSMEALFRALGRLEDSWCKRKQQ